MLLKIGRRVILSLFTIIVLISCGKDDDGPKGPVVTVKSFSPEKGTAQTTVKLKGENFGTLFEEVEVYFNGAKATITSLSDSVLVTTVPQEASTGKIMVKVKGVSGVSATDFTVVINPWKMKASIGYPNGRENAVAFAINNKAFVGLGEDSFDLISRKDFWEYDPSTNNWTQRADFPGVARTRAVAFVVNNKAYVGSGYSLETDTPLKDFWEYNPANNTWTRKADFMGEARESAVAFAIGEKGFVGTGKTGSKAQSDFWQYSAITDSWTEVAPIPAARAKAVAFVVGSRAYVGTGEYDSDDLKDFWEYNPATNSWVRKADAGGMVRKEAVAFSYNNYGYIGTGGLDYEDDYHRDFWKYNPVSDVWTQVTDFFGDKTIGFEYGYRHNAVAVVVGEKAYVGMGEGEFWNLTDWWEYSPE